MAHMLILLLVVVSTAAVTQACRKGGPLFGSLKGKCSDIEIVRRSEWRAMKPKTTTRTIPLPVTKLVIHHSDSPTGGTKSKCMKRMRNMQYHHMYLRKINGKPKTFWDIGYNYLVGIDGRAYEGRGWGYQGAHTTGHNRDAIAITAIGDYQDARPNLAVRQAIANLIDCALKEGALSPNFKMYGHRDLGSTQCPGRYMYEYVKKSSHFAG